MRKYSANGFTLMEVMITVVIVGILAAIAYPSYTNYVIQARRSDATIALSALAAQQEKFFTRCGGYADTIGLNPLGLCPPLPQGSPGGIIVAATVSLNVGGTTRDGYYNITILPAPGGTIANSFLLTAAPLVTQLSADGGKCTTIALNSTGAKSATGSDSLLGPNGGRCWRR